MRLETRFLLPDRWREHMKDRMLIAPSITLFLRVPPTRRKRLGGRYTVEWFGGNVLALHELPVETEPGIRCVIFAPIRCITDSRDIWQAPWVKPEDRE